MLVPKLYEYLLFVELAESTKAKVSTIKRQFSLRGCRNAINSVPHLTISDFLFHSHKEVRLVRKLGDFIRCFSPFNVALNGFQSFKSHTIFIDVDSSDDINHLVLMLKKNFRIFLKPGPKRRPIFALKSHVTIAKQMTPEEHKLLWAEWKDKPFSESFNVQKLRLIKREVDPVTLWPLQPYRYVQDFNLGGEGLVTYTQGNLFE